MSRDPAIDRLRGFAIVVMVAANMAADCLAAPHPWLFRVYASLAAPCFIFLAGMLAGVPRATVGGDLRHALERAVSLLSWALIIDVCLWGIDPFESFDVLYLLALAVPAARLCAALDVRVHAVVAAAFFVVTPFLQARYGYRLPLATADDAPSRVRRWLIDGWFPVFPWLGVALGGALFTRIRRSSAFWASSRPLGLTGGGLLLAGAVAVGSELYRSPFRAGYSELFYPPRPGALVALLGAVLVLLAAFSRVREAPALRWLEVYGRASLLLYLVHTVLIAFVFKKLFSSRSLGEFALLYAAHAAILGGVAVATERLRGPEQPRWLRLLLG